MLELSETALAPCETLAPLAVVVRAHHPSVQTVVEVVAKLCGLSAKTILRNPTHARRVAHPRQLAMYLCWRWGEDRASLTVVGRLFGKDHTTVLHAAVAVKKRICESAEWSLIHDRTIQCLANPALLDDDGCGPLPYPGAARAQPGMTARPKIAAVCQPRPNRPIGPVSQTPDQDPWLSQERRRQRLAVGAEIKSCAQVGKFCVSFGASNG